MATQPQQVTTAGGSRQRVLVLLLAVVLLIVLAVAVARPLLFGRSDVAAPAAPPASTASPASTTSVPTTTTGSGQPLGESKDPFHPLAVAGGAATGAATAGSTPSQSSVPGSGSGTAAVPGGGSTAERKVTLNDVSSQSGTRYVKVSVDGRSYSVKEGESFAGDYRVVDIGSACATFESGTTPFTLCEGEAVLK
jgi:flagellar basal body-associated protein FliL